MCLVYSKCLASTGSYCHYYPAWSDSKAFPVCRHKNVRKNSCWETTHLSLGRINYFVWKFLNPKIETSNFKWMSATFLAADPMLWSTPCLLSEKLSLLRTLCKLVQHLRISFKTWIFPGCYWLWNKQLCRRKVHHEKAQWLKMIHIWKEVFIISGIKIYPLGILWKLNERLYSIQILTHFHNIAML